MITKFGSKGLVNIDKAIPVLGGVIGGAVDALSTFAIANAAKALFLGDIISFEEQEKIQVEIIKIAINMSLADGECCLNEKETLRAMVTAVNLSQKSINMLYESIDRGQRQPVDFSLLVNDPIIQSSVLTGLIKIAKADGEVPLGEKIYIKSVAKELNCDDDTLQMLFDSIQN